MRKSLLLVVVAFLVLAAVPYLELPAFYESVLYLVFHWIALATSWNLLSGYSGYFSFGHGAFFGAGMYTTATLTTQFNIPFLWTLPAAAAVAALIGVLLGVVSFRVKAVRGELFALLTLAATFVVATIVLNTPIDGGPGVFLSAVALPEFGPSPSGTFYLMALAAAALTLLVAVAVYYSRFGAGLFAIHDDEDVAEVMGVPTFGYKLAAFALSCALAGMVGGIHALFVSYVTTGDVFTIWLPLVVVLMSILGGTRHWAGPAVGATVITFILYSFTGGDSAVIGKAMTGAILIIVILFMPDGILGWLLNKWRAYANRRSSTGSRAADHVPLAGRASVTSPSAEQSQAAARALSPKTASYGAGGLATDGAASAARLNYSASHNSNASASYNASADSNAASNSNVNAGEGDTPRVSPTVLLEARDITKSFRGVKALQGVSFNVYQGEILGLLGPNGSGKSTFINVVSGHFPATSGFLAFKGQAIAHTSAHRIARCGIARTYQIPRPFNHLTVLQNTALPAMFGAKQLSRSQAEQEAWQWLEFTGLADRAAALPEELNLHQRKFLEFARALASRPQLLMLDEVLSGLTPTEIDEAVALIQRIRSQGTTILFVEHVMRAVMALCDRVVVFNQGLVLAQGLPTEVMARPDVAAAYLGQGPDSGNDDSDYSSDGPAHEPSPSAIASSGSAGVPVHA